jgi:hypothetical protein
MSSRQFLEQYLFDAFATPGHGIEFAINVDGGPFGWADIHRALDVSVHLDATWETGVSTLIPYTAVVDATLFYASWPGGTSEPVLATHRMPLTVSSHIWIREPIPGDVRNARQYRDWLNEHLYPVVGSFVPVRTVLYRLDENGLPVQVFSSPAADLFAMVMRAGDVMVIAAPADPRQAETSRMGSVVPRRYPSLDAALAGNKGARIDVRHQLRTEAAEGAARSSRESLRP